MKTCNKCDVELVRGENIAPSKFDNRAYKCRECNNAGQRKYRKTDSGRAANARYENSEKGKVTNKRKFAKYENTPKARARKRRYVESDNGSEKIKEYSASDEGRESSRKSSARVWNGTDKAKNSSSKWRKENPHMTRAANAKRRAQKLNATPPWVDELAIKKFYKDCPEGYEVDHIAPLQGETVSGLHILENLQYLTISENRSKNNRWVA